MNKRAFRHKSPRDKGFTLVELMVTLAILVILLAIGVPAMQRFLTGRLAIANADAMASGIKYARSEALKRGQTVSMCLTTTANTVAPTCSTSTQNWSSGWLVYVDPTGACAFNNTQLLVRVQQQFTNGGAVNGDATRRCLTFTPDGLSVGSNGTFSVMSPDSSDTGAKRCIVLNRQGRVQVVLPGSDGSCS